MDPVCLPQYFLLNVNFIISLLLSPMKHLEIKMKKICDSSFVPLGRFLVSQWERLYSRKNIDWYKLRLAADRKEQQLVVNLNPTWNTEYCRCKQSCQTRPVTGRSLRRKNFFLTSTDKIILGLHTLVAAAFLNLKFCKQVSDWLIGWWISL